MGWLKRNYFLVLLLAIGILIVFNILSRKEPGDGEITGEDDGSVWVPVESQTLRDLIAMNFDPSGQIGAAISLDGFLLMTRDGGINWRMEGRAPIGEGEMAGSMAVRSGGRLVIGTGVDESRYTALYEFDGSQWMMHSSELGGLAGASSDGTFFVGGNGLFSHLEERGWRFGQLPQCGQVILYGAAREERRVLVAGDYGLVAQSEDSGRTWNCSTLPEEPIAPALYCAAIGGNVALVGGAGGSLWRFTSERWRKVKGLSSKMSVFALLLDKEGKEGVAAGGSDGGKWPFILYTTDGGRTWQRETVSRKYGRIVGLAQGRVGLFAATSDGHILARKGSALARAESSQ